MNGYKISNPTVFARMSHEEVENFFKGCGWDPIFVEAKDEMNDGIDPEDHIAMHKAMCEAMDSCSNSETCS